jgi:aldose 1-epimerase
MKRALLLTLTFAGIAAIFSSCNQSSKKKEMVKQEIYGTHRGKEVYMFTLTNKTGNVVRITNFGGKINWIEVPDKNGKKENITFGYDTFEGTITGDMSYGSVVGRYANRIANGKFPSITDPIHCTEVQVDGTASCGKPKC